MPTRKGHILINAGFATTVPVIQKNVEQLGFKFADVKILLASHAHNDHVEGTALVKRLTGAKVFVMRGDETVTASGGQGQYMYKHTWEPVRIDRVLRDGDQVAFGDELLVARHTPGHTRGCTTWTMRVRDAGKLYDVVIVGSPNVNAGYQLVDNKEYPEIASDFAKSFAIWKKLPCDIFLGAHGHYYGLLEKHPRMKPGAANPFVDPEGYKAYIAERERFYRTTLEQQSKRDAGAADAGPPAAAARKK